MTQRDYKRLTLVEMKKRRWRTVNVLRNGCMEIPAFVEVEIVGKGSGLRLAGPKCQKCGVRIFITKVGPWNVEEVR